MLTVMAQQTLLLYDVLQKYTQTCEVHSSSLKNASYPPSGGSRGGSTRVARAPKRNKYLQLSSYFQRASNRSWPLTQAAQTCEVEHETRRVAISLFSN